MPSAFSYCHEPGVDAEAVDESAIRDTVDDFSDVQDVYSGIFAQYANFGWVPPRRSSAGRTPRDRSWISRGLPVLSARRTRCSSVTTNIGRTRGNGLLRRRRLELVRAREPAIVFYDVDSADNRAAFATLHESRVTCRLLAPLRRSSRIGFITS